MVNSGDKVGEGRRSLHIQVLTGSTPVDVCLQVQQFSSKSTDTSLRVASLEYLGIVAARLRKDAISSHLNPEVISDIVHKVTDLLS